MLDGLRILLAAILAFGVTGIVEREGRRRELGPPWGASPERRGVALAFLALVFFVVFLGLAFVDRIPEEPPDPAIEPSTLFLLQFLLVGALALWFVLGWGAQAWPRARSELGLATRRPLEELSLGIGIGLPAWALALATTAAAGAAWKALGGEVPTLDDAPARQIAAVAGLSVATRLALSVTAGLVEEVFFRGFLQRRLGIFGATALFVVAHVGYGEVFLLFGVTVLSLVFGLLVRWRGNVWAAVVAHFLFDAIQLLVLIPWVLREHPPGP